MRLDRHTIVLLAAAGDTRALELLATNRRNFNDCARYVVRDGKLWLTTSLGGE